MNVVGWICKGYAKFAVSADVRLGWMQFDKKGPPINRRGCVVGKETDRACDMTEEMR